MAFSVGGSNSIGGRRRYSGTLAEINIVPLVDVVLVLLIIFMVTASVMEFGLEIDVPKVKKVVDTAEELPVVSITRDAKIFLNGKTVNINEISAEVHKRFKNAKAVYVMADKDTIFDPIAQVIAEIGEDGGLQIKLVAKPMENSGKQK
jgi:biopolymer transport protein ExbD